MSKFLASHISKVQQLGLLIQPEGNLVTKMVFDERSALDYLLGNQIDICNVISTSYGMWIKNNSKWLP